MAKKAKSVVHESMKQGFGSEFGKKLAIITIAILTLLGLAVWGLVSDSAVGTSIQELNKSHSGPSNSQ